MNREYTRITTTYLVWVTILGAHPELVPFASFTHTQGTGNNPTMGQIYTSYGFEGTEFPIMEALTTWDIDHLNPTARNNTNYEYWLCVGKKEDYNE